MILNYCLITVAVGVLWSSPGGARSEGEPRRFEFTGEAMAAPVKIIIYTEEPQKAAFAVERVFRRINELNSLFSDYDPESELNRLCHGVPSGTPMPVSPALWDILVRAQYFSELTSGAFDITVGPVVRLWRRARRQQTLPEPHRLAEASRSIGYRKVNLDLATRQVTLLANGMQLDLGGIAKGYAADQAVQLLRKEGISRVLVDVGGDICLGDPPPNAAGWRIAIEPLRADDSPLQILLLSRCAVATSGDTQRYVVINGTRYSHIIDPRTGWAMTGNMSVTVVAADGTTADAMASAIRVLGPKEGLPLLEKLPGAAAFVAFLPDHAPPEQKPQVWMSETWNSLLRIPVPEDDKVEAYNGN